MKADLKMNHIGIKEMKTIVTEVNNENKILGYYLN